MHAFQYKQQSSLAAPLPPSTNNPAGPIFFSFPFNSSSSNDSRTILGTCRGTQLEIISYIDALQQQVRYGAASPTYRPPPPAAAMRKSTILLMALALALIPVQQKVVATPLTLRRSRFLANFPPPSSFYDCSKEKSPSKSICLSPGSPGTTCCQGKCVDTKYSFQHCGNCNKTCKFAQTCCESKCVNTFTDEKNCGGCGVKCRTKCTNGYCDYAA